MSNLNQLNRDLVLNSSPLNPRSLNSRSIAIIGGGPMGLASAAKLAKSGHQVTLFEADDRLGGMTASFDFDGVEIERFYHFICKTDAPLFATLKDLGIESALKWTNTSMGLFTQGKTYPWGRPDALLRFPHLDLISKIRYGLMALRCSRLKDLSKLDDCYADQWLLKNCGKKGYDLLWKQLLEQKFFHYQTNISAAWIASRIRRIGQSRKNIFQEQLGYLEGGSQLLIDAWETEILRLGGKIKLSLGVEKLIVEPNPTTKKNQAIGLVAGKTEYYFDQIISTVPLPYVLKFAPQLASEEKDLLKQIKYVGVRCVLLKLKHPLLPHFWTNISDPEIPTPGLIEYTNLRPMICDSLNIHLVYAPYYLPHNHPRYQTSDEDLIEETIKLVKKLNPKLKNSSIMATKATRYHLAQTVCTPRFAESLPPMRTSLSGFFMADTSYYYPEDRSISESIALGETLAHSCLMDELPSFGAKNTTGGVQLGRLAQGV